MKPTILFFRIFTQYDVINKFSEQLESVFQQHFNVVVFDLTDPNPKITLEEIIEKNNVLAIISFNGNFLDVALSNRDYFNQSKTPIYTILVDHPIYLYDRLMNLTENTIISCIALEHVYFLQQVMKIENPVFFLPHGAVALNNETPKAIQDRSIDILFSGSYLNPDEKINNIKQLPQQLQNLLFYAIEIALSDSKLDYQEITTQVFNKFNVPNSYYFKKTWWILFIYVDSYLRGVQRNNFIKSIANLSDKYKIKLYGNGWESSGIEMKNINVCGSTDFTTIYNEMHNSKIVATVLPNFHQGLHERVFTAMHTGAVNLVDKNEFLEQHLIDGKHYIPYDINNIHIEQIDKYLNEPEKLQTISKNAYDYVNESHLWEHRAYEIIQHIFLHRDLTLAD